jgi:hypothetical protein
MRTRTVLPSAHPRPASVELRTSSWLAPSRAHQQALRPPGGEDARCVRPMSATQTNYVYPHLARSRLALAAFAGGRPTETKAPCGVTGEPDVSRRPRSASADRQTTLLSSSTASRPGDTSVGVFFPRRCWRPSLWHPCRNPLVSPSRLARLRERCNLAVRLPFGRVGTGRRMRRLPRPPLAPARESLRLVMIRDAFDR